MTLSLDDLDLLPPTGEEGGAPLRIPLDAIDEDPDQPRQEFDEQSLNELAETIRERGVRQPVSVRTHPTKPGRWMLNFGARRLRACRRVGLSEVPAFVDQTANSVDQFIENEQRKGLSPLEIALFVQRSLNKGQTQADIARAIGKSRQYVTLATALIDPPDWLMAAYREGRCRGLNELHELRKLAAEHPQYVEAWTSDRSPITRDGVMALRTELAAGSGSVRRGTSALLESMEANLRMGDTHSAPEKKRAPSSMRSGSTSQRCLQAPMRLLALLNGTEVVVNTLQAPPKVGQVYVIPVKGGQKKAVDASQLTLIGLERDLSCQSD
ncbi:MAG: chromosome partitioning protein ParB [Betaproteobacteria bacterium HGW-Betaproteobacteria-16]|nr:MAG: chromosome partitioning protein ParB [Betaproteobacteria bacterium HGW-Betaproteobacteria-16]